MKRPITGLPNHAATITDFSVLTQPRWYPDPDNRLRQPSFNQVNAQLSWTSPDKRFKLTVWGRNLNNEVFAQYFSDSDATSDVYSVSPPRTYGVTLGASF
jgi:iron complex outermembrane receptor protein